MGLELSGITIQNLRGFRRASLDLTQNVTLLVGPNNAGKTSLLRLLQWSHSGVDMNLLEGKRSRSVAENELLLPARKANGSARRIVLHIKIQDGRRHKRFHAKNGVAQLRLRIVANGVYAAVSPPKRNEGKESEDDAIDLWREFHDQVPVLHVRAPRDASSEQFRATLSLVIRKRLMEYATHNVRGGAPSHYRKLKNNVKELGDVANEIVEELWKAFSARLPTGLVRSGGFQVDLETKSLVDWLVESTDFRMSTGQHDKESVRPSEVGTGLQSLLHLALLEVVNDLPGQSWLLLEEPEAFLHPAAQRQVADGILSDGSVRRIISTHSPIIVDESSYGQVALVKDHQIFQPNFESATRDEINTSLLSVDAAESIFSDSVLLVEGPGDRAFFEGLRRRLAKADNSGRTHRLGLVAVGGKKRFGPWVKLFQSYADSHGRLPIAWLAVADSKDASHDLATGLKDAGLTLPRDILQHIHNVDSTFKSEKTREGIEATQVLNSMSEKKKIGMALLPVDLEYAMLEAASEGTTQTLCKLIAVRAPTTSELVRHLREKKSPWMRARIAHAMPWPEISENVKSILERWLAGVMSRTDASEVVRNTE